MFTHFKLQGIKRSIRLEGQTGTREIVQLKVFCTVHADFLPFYESNVAAFTEYGNLLGETLLHRRDVSS